MSKISRKETKAMDTNAQIICANLVSGSCTSPLVDKVFNSIGSYLPLHKFQIAVSTLANMGEYRKAFDLICAIYEIVDGEIPDELITIEPLQEVVSLFVNEFTEDLASTMIPVRFVTEQLGAKVSWDDKTQAAVIEKNGIRVDIPIGESVLKVTKAGNVQSVKMDTEAVLKEGRTYVPIRFVAEALVAVVDYSDSFRTVGIYLEELTAEEIATLRGYAYTQPEYAIGYENAKTMYSAGDLAYYYGTQRDSFTNFANAHEHLYHTLARTGKYYFKGIETIMENGSDDAFYANVVKEAIAEVAYQSERLTVSFRTDNSCIYQADAINSLTTCVRGIVTARLSVKPTELTGSETAMLCRIGYTQLYKDVDMSIPVDVHMNTTPNYRVSVHTFVALDEAH